MLWVLILLPAAVGFALFLLPRDAMRSAKAIGTVVAAITFGLAVASHGQSVSVHWLSRPFDAAFHFAASGLSFWIVLLLALSTFGAVLATTATPARSFVALLLLLESSMLALFLARDLLVFAFTWDLMLLPVFFCLIRWCVHAQVAWRYVIYNFAGGLALLLAVAAFGIIAGTTDVIGRSDLHVAGAWAPWIFAGMAFAFLVKTPVWPLHTWMPPTYEQTPAPMISVVAAVQSKAGLYGFIVICLPFLTEAMRAYAGILLVLGAISLLYGAFVALTQTDAKRVVAYSSLSHLGLILIAIFAFDPIALQGAAIYIIAHGLFSAALFLVIGYMEEREGTRSLLRLRGLGRDNPRLAGAFCIAALAALGLPGLAGFAGELVILTGVFQGGLLWAVIVALVAIVLAAAYLLRLYQGSMNGPELPGLPQRRDLTWLEGLAVAPLLAALVVVGVNPHLLTMGILR